MGVLRLGHLGPPDDAFVEVVVRDDGGLAVDVAHVPADYRHVSARVQVQSGCDAGWWRDPFDVEVLPCRVVALALDVGFPGASPARDLRVSLAAQGKATAWTAGDQITWTGPGAQAEEYRKAVHARDR